MLISWRQFGGEVPRLDPESLPEPHGQYALRADFNRNDLRGAPSQFYLTSLATTVRALYSNDGLRFLSWDYDVDAFRGPVIEDAYKRIYFSLGTSQGKNGGLYVTFDDQQKLGGGEPAFSYRVGVPPVTGKPVITPIAWAPTITVAGTFFYEAGGVKYQEQPVALVAVEVGKSYRFTPPAKNVYGVGSTTVPGTGSDIFTCTGYITTGNGPVSFGTATTAQATGPDTILLADGTSIAGVTHIRDKNLQMVSMDGVWALTDFGSLVDPGLAVTTTGETAANASQTPTGFTPDNAMPALRLIGTDYSDNSKVLFDVYSSGSSFNVTEPKVAVALAASGAEMTVSLDFDTAAGASARLKETRAYVVTLINAHGEESIPSDPVIVDVNIFQVVWVNLTGLMPLPQGTVTIDKVRLYRTATGISGVTEYFQVLDQPVSSGISFYDQVKTTALSADICPSWTWDQPPTDLTGVVYVGNGMLAGISGTGVYFCEPYRPHAWPREYVKQFPGKPIRLMPHQNSIVVTTTDYPYLLTGSTPDGMVQQRLAADQAAVSKRAHADLGGMIAYATNDGIALVSGGQVSIAQSLSLWGRDKWRELYGGVLDSLHFAAHDGQLLMFWEGGANSGKQVLIRFDEASGNLSRLTDALTGAFRLEKTDSLYTANGAAISKWGHSGTSAYIWHTREIKLPKPYNLGAIQVLGEGSYTATVYTDGAPQAQFFLGNGSEIGRLDTGIVGRYYSVRIEGASGSIVREIHLANTVQELRQV